MKILYVTSEANPYAASGGLGDVMGAFPKAAGKREDVTAEVIMPLYDVVKQEYRDKMELVADITFSLSWRKTGASVYKLQNETATYYFLENHYYFDRKKLYGEYDDAERFAFFSRAVVEYMLYTGNIPDILHANDWQTAMTIVYLKTEYSSIASLSRIKTVFTIHNIEYQGKFDPYILGDVFGVDAKYKSILEYDGAINLMKGAIVSCDFVTTVSPNYANELRYDFFSFGLSSIIESVQHKMQGVINGIDYGYFSPEQGGDIYVPYSTSNYKAGKAKNKKLLCEELGLDTDPSIPLLVMITRLTHGKGIDLVLEVLEQLLAEKVQIVMLGTGDCQYEEAFSSIADRHSNFKALITFDRVLSKKMYAAADMFLMPSKSEPCGLAQMIACSYGTVPIVRSVGGLFDSIIPYGVKEANGFRFDTFNAHEMLSVIKLALSVYGDKRKWNKLTSTAKISNFSWELSAEKYIQIYEKIL